MNYYEKNCPFCDSENVVLIDEDSIDKQDLLLAIHCLNCQAYGPRVFTPIISLTNTADKDYYDATQEAKKLWKKRPNRINYSISMLILLITMLALSLWIIYEVRHL